jgi:hypothetical protein
MIGVHSTVSRSTNPSYCTSRFTQPLFLENLASHRAELLSELLPIALARGLAETEPHNEPLKVSLSTWLRVTG